MNGYTINRNYFPMKRSILLIISILIIHFSLYANQAKDIRDLKQIASTSTGEAKIDAQNELCTALIQNTDLKEAELLVKGIKSTATQLNYHKGIADAIDNEGYIFVEKYDYTNAMNRFLSALKIRNTLADETSIATSKNNIGHVHLLLEEYDSAIDNFNVALNTRESTADIAGSAETHQFLGDTYLKKKLYGKAKDHYKRALDLRIKMEDFQGAASIASFLGTIVSDLGDYEGALVYYNMSLDLNSSVEDLPNIARDYSNIAQIYQAQEAYPDALEAHKIALTIRKDLGDKMGLAETYKNIGVLHTYENKKSKALSNLSKCTSLLNDISEEPGVYKIYRSVSQAYEKLGDYKKAFQYHTAYATTKDDFFTQEKSKEITRLTTQYESEFAAEEQATTISRLELEKTTSNRIRIFLMALVGLIGLLAMSLYSNNQRKKRDNELLTTKNEEIQRQSDEIDVKNNELEETNKRLDFLNGKLVTEMTERESIEKSSFERDSFLATMSHEMRTPMNAIVGITHLLLDDNPRKNQVEQLRNLQFSANNLTVFINDILDFSKIEAGKLNLQSREFAPKDIFDEIYNRFQNPIEDKGVKFNYHYDDRIPTKLMGDPARINQIVNNLVSNAMQLTDNGMVKLDVYLDEFNTKETVLKINIEDTGKGINQNLINKMFQKFDGKSKDVFEGYERSGIALSMAKRLTELQNGKIDVDTSSDGTKFTIYIPCKRIEETEHTANKVTVATPTIPESKSDYAGSKILIVEDNKINQLVVAKMLIKIGMKVETANNGKEGVEFMEKEDFDLILMDIQMPIMDGYKATTEIRNMKDVKKSNIPIIALTASAFLSETEKAKLFGMNDHVGKPFGPEDLIEKIHLCLSKVEAHSAI